MEFSIKVLVGIVLAVITFLIILGLMGVFNDQSHAQLGNFFDFIGGIKPPEV